MFVEGRPVQHVNPQLALATTAAWLAALYLASLLLARRVKAIRPEEIALR